MTPPELNPAEFASFVLIFIRVSILLFLAPIFGSALVPDQVKAAMALVFTFMLSATVKVDPGVFPTDLFSFAPLILGEVFVALFITLVIRMILEGIQLAGQYIGYQMGFAVANVINPQTGTQASVLSQFAYILAMVIFLSLNGHYLIIKAMMESFELAPPGKVLMTTLAFSEVSRSMGGLFVIAVKIGAPALVVLFCTKVAMGIVAKTVPQMNVLFVGMPLYIVIGLVVFGLSLGFMTPIVGRAVALADQSILAVLRAM